MPTNHRLPLRKLNVSKTACAVSVLLAATAIAARAQIVTTITNLVGTAYPAGSLIQGADGNFYGIASYGNNPFCFGVGCGQFFKISPQGMLTILYNFCSQTGCADGGSPTALVQAADGTFYGTTENGGNTNCYGGCGTVFKITSSGILTTLYSFCSQQNCNDGTNPTGLLLATDGQFYGTTAFGGLSECGKSSGSP